MRHVLPMDMQLFGALARVPEVRASGFTVSSGLSGRGVTLIHRGQYCGSWRMHKSCLQWISADPRVSDALAGSVEDAMRMTLMMVLRQLEVRCTDRRMARAS